MYLLSMNYYKFVTAVRCEFQSHFNIHQNQSVPTYTTIIRCVNALGTQGKLLDRRLVGALRTVRKSENMERVRQTMLRSTNRFFRRDSIELGICNRSVKRILQEDLHLHLDKLVVQLLKPGDYAQRLNFAGQMKAIFVANDNPIWLMRDEAHFHLNGLVN